MFDFLHYIPLIGNSLAVIVPFFIVLSIVIFIHEFGHYIVGRWCGIHAEAFSMGFGPVLVSWYDKRGTRWQISALPLGGYVKFLGDADGASGVDPEVLDKMPPELRSKTLHGAALWRRALTVFAGPAANFVLSLVIFSVMTFGTGVATNDAIVGDLRQFPGIKNELQTGDRILEINGIKIDSRDDISAFLFDKEPTEITTYRIERDGQPLLVEGPFPWLPIVAGVNPVTPASKAGLKAGDLILRVGDTDINSFPQLQKVVQNAKEEAIPFVVQRGTQTLTLTVTPRKMPFEKEDGSFGTKTMIGIGGTVAFGPYVQPVGPLEAVYYGGLNILGIIDGWARTIYHLLSGGLDLKNLQGPVGIAVASGDTASQGPMEFIFLIGFISTAIGLMNLLPIPVLDGGHLLFFAYEAIFRRKPNTKFLQILMAAGMSILLLLMLFASYNDIMRL